VVGKATDALGDVGGEGFENESKGTLAEITDTHQVGKGVFQLGW
jgi:hypothetical protein